MRKRIGAALVAAALSAATFGTTMASVETPRPRPPGAPGPAVNVEMVGVQTAPPDEARKPEQSPAPTLPPIRQAKETTATASPQATISAENARARTEWIATSMGVGCGILGFLAGMFVTRRDVAYAARLRRKAEKRAQQQTRKPGRA